MNIVQIGVNRGYDDVTPIVNDNLSTLEKFIAIEPLSVLHEDIKKCYKNVNQMIIEGLVITPHLTENKATFYYHVDDGPGYEVASMNKEHILKHVIYNPKLTVDGLVELQVDCLTINQLFDRHNLSKIDLLYIDAEGLDFEIIKSIDFEKYDILKITYEHLHVDGELVINFLESKGYSTMRNQGHNGWSHSAIKK